MSTHTVIFACVLFPLARNDQGSQSICSLRITDFLFLLPMFFRWAVVFPKDLFTFRFIWILPERRSCTTELRWADLFWDSPKCLLMSTGSRKKYVQLYSSGGVFNNFKIQHGNSILVTGSSKMELLKLASVILSNIPPTCSFAGARIPRLRSSLRKVLSSIASSHASVRGTRGVAWEKPGQRST